MLNRARSEPAGLGVQIHTGWILNAVEVTPLLSPDCLDAAAVPKGDAQGVVSFLTVERSEEHTSELQSR